MPYSAFEIQRYERTYNLSLYAIRCITGKNIPLLRLKLGRDLVCCVTYFTLKPCFIIRTKPLELCAELKMSIFANINQELYSRYQNYCTAP